MYVNQRCARVLYAVRKRQFALDRAFYLQASALSIFLFLRLAQTGFLDADCRVQAVRTLRFSRQYGFEKE